MSQLPLALKLPPYAAFDSFVAGRNGDAVEHVRAVATGRRADSIWLSGQPGTGRSHLLSAACRAAGEAGRTAILLPMAAGLDPALLAELDAIDLIAIDDIDLVAGQAGWEQAFFVLYNERLQRGGLVAAASGAPQECGLALPDLVSRAGASALYRLNALNDDELAQAVSVHARMRGLDLDSAAVNYLLQRVSRDIGKLTECLDRVDRFSLAEKRRITIPLLREAIGL